MHPYALERSGSATAGSGPEGPSPPPSGWGAGRPFSLLGYKDSTPGGPRSAPVSVPRPEVHALSPPKDALEGTYTPPKNFQKGSPYIERYPYIYSKIPPTVDEKDYDRRPGENHIRGSRFNARSVHLRTNVSKQIVPVVFGSLMKPGVLGSLVVCLIYGECARVHAARQIEHFWLLSRGTTG